MQTKHWIVVGILVGFFIFLWSDRYEVKMVVTHEGLANQTIRTDTWTGDACLLATSQEKNWTGLPWCDQER